MAYKFVLLSTSKHREEPEEGSNDEKQNFFRLWIITSSGFCSLHLSLYDPQVCINNRLCTTEMWNFLISISQETQSLVLSGERDPYLSSLVKVTAERFYFWEFFVGAGGNWKLSTLEHVPAPLNPLFQYTCKTLTLGLLYQLPRALLFV